MDENKRYMLQSLSGRIYKSNWPLFTCSNCNKDMQKVTNLNYEESIDSASLHDHPAWDPEWINGGFAAVSTCQNCKDKAYLIGTYSMEEMYSEDETGQPHADYVARFEIKAITPALNLIALPKKCPDDISKALLNASEVIFMSPDLAVNKIRSSLDLLLTDQKIPRFTNSKGKRVRLTTHKRIKIFAINNAEVAGLLEAVKWIGNEGSHTSNLSFNDVIDGLEIYSLALNLIYNNVTTSIKKKAAMINKNRGIKKNVRPF